MAGAHGRLIAVATGVHRRVVLCLLLLLLLPGCAGRSPGAPPPAAVRLTLLQINDAYLLEPTDGGRRGGMARLATLVKRVRASSPHTIFAHAGDAISPSPMSTMLRGEQMIAALNAVGLDVATFGNHEFDFGPAVLRQRMAESRFVWLSANVVERGPARPFGGALAERLLDLGPLRVGLFGLTIPETASTSAAGPDIVFEDARATGVRAATSLRARGAQVVVAVTHQEMRHDRALAAAADIDVVLGGHDHEPLVAEEGKTLVTKAGSDARYLVQVDLWVAPDGRLLERSFAFHEVSARVPEDPEVAALVRRYTERLGRELEVVVGQTAVPLEARRARLRSQETNLGSFLADAMRARMGTDLAVMNGGGIRTDRIVPAGPLTKRDILSMLPFANVVLKLEVSGARLREALEQALASDAHGGGGFPQLSGARLVFDPARPAGQRIVRVDVAGAPLDPGRSYTLAVVDYLAAGGDGIVALRDARVVVGSMSGPQLTDVLLDAIVAAGTIAPVTDGRVITTP